MPNQQRIAIINSVIILATILSGSIVLLSLFISSPRQIGPVGVTLWFVVGFIFLGGVLALGNYYYKKGKIDNKSQLNVIFKNSIRGGYLLSALLIILLALQSLRMLTIGDTVLFVLTILIVELYFRTRKQ